MAIKVSDIITRATDLLQDQTNVRWPSDELLRYINDCRREIAIVRPDLYAVTTTVTLVAGTKQSLPTDGVRFLDGVRNMGADGVTPGKAVRITEREILDAQRPDWHTEAAGPIRHFMFDERSPRTFFVYPPAAAGQKMELVYAKSPVDITATTTELTEEDIYTGAILDYVCYRAFSKDAEYAGNNERAMMHYQQFLNAIGGGAKVNMIVSPNVADVGGMTPRIGQAANA